MGTDAPQISVLLAVYEPRADWLRELLLSLNEQTYPNVRLWVRDDCSSGASFMETERLLKACITAFPYVLRRNEANLGSNATFERLTGEADGAYFAYCDQDDVWRKDKLHVLLSVIEQNHNALACSDVIPMDAEGKPLASSITALRPRHRFLEGEGLAAGLLYRNFVIGCTMLVRAALAKAAIPFAPGMVHDHYLAFYAAREHGIGVAAVPLVQYRLHGGNQTGVLAHVQTWADYCREYVFPFCCRVEALQQRFPADVPEETVRWAKVRRANAAGEKGAARQLFAMRHVHGSVALFELLAPHFPGWLFGYAVGLIRKGKI